MTLDRINNDGDYTPENCKWSTWKEQAQNRKKGGNPIDKTSLRQRALSVGLPYMCVYLRVNKLGWSVKRALSVPKAERFTRGMSEVEKAQRQLKALVEEVCPVEASLGAMVPSV